ncbi:hypothetical protein AAHA92_15754 [Salvia divinorum]|uniref:Uncharacterized protein n=1 Tax=Salvia divinorum TaxID=28513 RepID=A0ABD1FQ45_SALDI
MNEFIPDEVAATCPMNFDMVMLQDNQGNDGVDQPMNSGDQPMESGEDATNEGDTSPNPLFATVFIVSWFPP